MHRIFLLSPANLGGKRAEMVFNEGAKFDLAVKLRRTGATIGEIYTFVSGLYFRGKQAYAQAFATPPPGLAGSYVITPGRGLLLPETPITIDELRVMAAVPIDLADARYRAPLESAARVLEEAAGPGCQFILLGSVATAKYVDPLLKLFGERLLFPAEFAGRGDMSRGGLMLRCSRAGLELTYTRIDSSSRHGPRPPKLPR